MKNDDYSVVLLNDFLLNAGVVGLLRVFQYADNYGGGCIQGEDYIIDGQRLLIKNEFFLNRNIGDLFVRAMVYHLGGATKYERVLGQKETLDALYAQPKPEDKAWQKTVDAIMKEFADMLWKSSFKSGYIILAQCEGIQAPTEEMVEALKKEKDYDRKKELYDKLYALLQQEKVREILVFKDLLYSVVNLFYADNKGNGAAFLSKREIEPAEAFQLDFVEPLRAELTQTPSRSRGVCIGCGGSADKKNLVSITKFVDTADDMGKKKSYYWNENPDAYLCPLCALVCAMAPLGFAYSGSDGVFVNNNSDIETLWEFSNALAEHQQERGQSPWYQLYNAFTSEKMERLSARASNVQVIVREKQTEKYKYSLSIVDKHTVTLLYDNKTAFQALEKRYVKDNEEYINVYQQTVENVVKKRNQFPLLTRLLHLALSGEKQQTGYLMHILNIQIAQKGGANVEQNKKRAFVAKKQGEALRAKLTEGLPEADKDNKLRGLTYQLLNAVSLGNRDKFLELVLRTYGGAGVPVPDIFFSCFGSEEEFKEIGYAYLLGLKSEGYKKEEETAP